MDSKQLAEQILEEVKTKQRHLMYPGVLDCVPISQAEAETLGLNPPAENTWMPQTTRAKLIEIAGA